MTVFLSSLNLKHLRSDVGKNCGPRSVPCGFSCQSRKRKIKCKTATSGTAVEANKKNRSKEARRLIKERATKKSLAKGSAGRAQKAVARTARASGYFVENVGDKKTLDGLRVSRPDGLNLTFRSVGKGREVERDFIGETHISTTRANRPGSQYRMRKETRFLGRDSFKNSRDALKFMREYMELNPVSKNEP